MRDDRNRISAFDLDRTLLSVTSSFAFAKFLYARKNFSLTQLSFVLLYTASHKLGYLSIEDVHRCAFDRLFLGMNANKIRQLAQQFVTLSLENLLYFPALERLKKAQLAGEKTVVLSSSPDFLVEPISKQLGVTTCLATQYAVDKDGCFCHISDIVQGHQKAAFVAQMRRETGCEVKDVTAYSDSHHDLEFLKSAGVAVGVNADRKLRAFCKANGWMMI